MLEQAAGLTSGTLQAVAELERQVVEADGGRLKLEWDNLRGRSGAHVEDLLWWEGERLLGFLGIYRFGNPPELAGMVAPDARGRGIGSALLDAAVSLCRERGDRPPLLVVPRTSCKASGWRCVAAGGQTTQSIISSCSASRVVDRTGPRSASGRRPSQMCRSSYPCWSKVLDGRDQMISAIA